MTLIAPRPVAPRRPDAPTPAPGWEGWKFTAGVAATTVAVAVFVVFFLPALFGTPIWVPPGDASATVQTAQYIANGGLGSMYASNTEILVLPGLPLILTPFAALGDHLGLVNDYPYVVPHATMMLVTEPVLVLCGVTCLFGVDYLAATLGVALRRRRLIVVAMVPTVVLPTSCYIGHPEDLLALCLSAFALAFLVRGRPAHAAVAVAVAVLMQEWALLLIPLLVVASPRGQRLRSLLLASALPALCGLTLLACDWNDAYRALVVQPMQGRGQHLPFWAFTHPYVYAGNRWLVGSEPRYLAVATAITGACLIRRRVTPDAILLVAATDLVARGVFETQVWPYYLAPGAVLMALVAARSATTRQWLTGALAAFVFAGGLSTIYVPLGPVLNPYLALAILLVPSAWILGRPWAAYRTSPAMAESTPLTNRPDSSVE